MEKKQSKILVAYFSASGVTAKTAALLADVAGAALYEIKPSVPYTKEDLNWNNSQSRSSVEMADHSFRPALADQKLNILDYDVFFLGFPIWWYIAPTIINTFLESYDFSGKKIILFATSGGSGFGQTVAELKKSISADTIIQEGKVFHGVPSLEVVKQWFDSL